MPFNIQLMVIRVGQLKIFIHLKSGLFGTFTSLVSVLFKLLFVNTQTLKKIKIQHWSLGYVTSHTFPQSLVETARHSTIQFDPV